MSNMFHSNARKSNQSRNKIPIEYNQIIIVDVMYKLTIHYIHYIEYKQIIIEDWVLSF